MQLLRSDLRTAMMPPAYRRAAENGRREAFAAAVGMERSSGLKVAWWRGSVVAEHTQPCPEFASIFLHLGGAQVRRADGISERAGPGAVVAPSVLEATAWESEGAFEWCQFYLSRRVLDEVAGERHGLPTPELDLDRRAVAGSPAIAGLASRACDELLSGSASLLELDAWAVLLAESWLRHFAIDGSRPTLQVTAAKGAHHSRTVLRAIAFVEAHLDRNLRLEQIAKSAGVNRFHLVRLFREFVGETPAAFARRLRIERSQVLLRTSKLPISKIALACGFADQSHFTTTFRRRTGVTPSVYRRKS